MDAAKAIDEIMVLHIKHWRGIERECALTYAESGASACQVGFGEYLEAQKQAMALLSRLANTHIRDSAKKRR